MYISRSTLVIMHRVEHDCAKCSCAWITVYRVKRKQSDYQSLQNLSLARITSFTGNRVRQLESGRVEKTKVIHIHNYLHIAQYLK